MNLAWRTGGHRWLRACYGIDAGPEGFVAVRAVRRGRRVVFEEPIRIAQGQALPAGAAACALDGRESFTARVSSPLASPAKVRRVLASLLDVQLPFRVEECVYGVADLGRTESGGLEALVAVARRDDLLRRLDGWRGLGLDPVAVDQEGLALWSQAQAERPAGAEGEARAVVYVGADRTAVALGTGDRLVSTHHIGSRAGPDALDRLARAAFRGAASSVRWILCGPAAEGGAADDLRTALLARWPGACETVDSPGPFLARALGARMLTAPVVPCDFRAGTLAHPLVRRRAATEAATTAGAVLAAGLLLCAASGLWRAAMGREIALADKRVQNIALQIAPGVRLARGQEVLQVQRRLDAERERAAPLLAAFGRPLAESLSGIAAAAADEGITLQTLSLREGSCSASGSAPSWEACTRLEAKIAALGFSVRVERQETIAKDEIRFSILPRARR